MKRTKIFAAFLSILFISIFAIPRVFAQSQPTIARPNSTWSCLTPETKIDETRDARVGEWPTQNVTLTGECNPAGAQCYIVTCITSEEGYKCTTGNNQYDAELGFGTNNYTAMQNDLHFKHPEGGTKVPYMLFKVKTGVKVSPPDGKVRTTIEMGSEAYVNWSFYALSINNPTPTQPPLDTDVTDDTGDQSALEYKTLEFEPVENQEISTCLSYRADPYGIVFDSQSLEPLPKAVVTLLDNAKQKVFQPGVTNPQKTTVDGVFNFVVEAGTYFMQVTGLSRYTFSDKPYIHPNYTKAYSDIYKPNDPIVETGTTLVHRDIALDPGVNTPYRADPVNMNYGAEQLGENMKIVGKQSHPLTIVTFKQGEIILKATTADKYGFYEARIPNTIISLTQPIDVYLTKVDLTADVPGQEAIKSISINPIPPYIEGIATKKDGTPIPSARVVVKLEHSNQVYTETQADEAGGFVLDPKTLPPVAYVLEFTAPNSSIVTRLTPMEFANLNANYLAQNNINLMTATKQGVSLLKKPQAQEQAPVQNNQPENLGGIVGDNNVKKAQSATNLALALALAGILLLAIVGFVIFTIRKKTTSSPSDTFTPPSSLL